MQIAVGEADVVTVGFGTTVRLMVVLPKQPAALVPVAVYTVVETGDTVTREPVRAPGFHV